MPCSSEQSHARTRANSPHARLFPLAAAPATGEAGAMSRHDLRLGRRSIIGQHYLLTFVCRARHRAFDNPQAVTAVRMALAQSDEQAVTCSTAWVIMPDHVHWLFELQDKTLGFVAQRFKSATAFRVGRQGGHPAGLWGPAYHDHAIRSDESLRRHARYIVANPVRKGLSEQVGEYPHAWCRWVL